MHKTKLPILSFLSPRAVVLKELSVLGVPGLFLPHSQHSGVSLYQNKETMWSKATNDFPIAKASG